MTPPNPLALNIVGIATRPHDDPKRAGYLVCVPNVGSLWLPVEDAIRSGLVPEPPPLPSSIPSQPFDHAETTARINELLNQTKAITQ